MMLLALGLGSQFGTMEGVITNLFDMKIFARVRKELLTGQLETRENYFIINILQFVKLETKYLCNQVYCSICAKYLASIFLVCHQKFLFFNRNRMWHIPDHWIDFLHWCWRILAHAVRYVCWINGSHIHCLLWICGHLLRIRAQKIHWWHWKNDRCSSWLVLASNVEVHYSLYHHLHRHILSGLQNNESTWVHSLQEGTGRMKLISWNLTRSDHA